MFAKSQLKDAKSELKAAERHISRELMLLTATVR